VPENILSLKGLMQRLWWLWYYTVYWYIFIYINAKQFCVTLSMWSYITLLLCTVLRRHMFFLVWYCLTFWLHVFCRKTIVTVFASYSSISLQLSIRYQVYKEIAIWRSLEFVKGNGGDILLNIWIGQALVMQPNYTLSKTEDVRWKTEYNLPIHC